MPGEAEARPHGQHLHLSLLPRLILISPPPEVERPVTASVVEHRTLMVAAEHLEGQAGDRRQRRTLILLVEGHLQEALGGHQHRHLIPTPMVAVRLAGVDLGHLQQLTRVAVGGPHRHPTTVQVRQYGYVVLVSAVTSRTFSSLDS